MHHKDFLGQKLNTGDFIAYPGGGNSKCEYGTILKRITALRPDGGIQAERLYVTYPDHKTPKVSKSKSVIKSLTKVVKVNPPPQAISLFENPELNPEVVATWVHGTNLIDWDASGIIPE